MSDLMQRLRDGATFDSRGAFSLDRRKALDKMREFQLVDAHDYVLFLVQAAVAAGAASVDFTSGTAAAAEGASACVSMPGLVLEKTFLDDPWSGLFLSQERPDADAWRCMSVALNALLSLDEGAVTLESGAWICTLTREGAAVAAAERPWAGARVRLREGWLTAAARALGASPEVRALQAKAWPSPIPISLNGAPLAGEAWEAAAQRKVSAEGTWLDAVSCERDGFRAVLFAGAASGGTTVVKRGVVVTERALDLPMSPRVVVFADRLLTNASGSDVVEDEAWQALLGLLSEGCDRLVEALARRCREADPVGVSCRRLLMSEVGRRFIVRKRRGKPGIEAVTDGAAAAALRQAPLFSRLDGGHATLDELQGELQARGRVLWHTRPLAASAELLVLRPTHGGEGQALNALLGDLFVELSADDPAMRRLVNLERWRRARAIPQLPPSGGDQETRSFNEGGFNGELRLDAAGTARISVFVDGRFLVEREVELHGMSMRAAVNARAFKPDFTFENVVEDDAWRAGLAFLAEQYETACAQWCGRVPTTAAVAADIAPHVRAVLAWYRASLRDPGALPAVLRAQPALPTASGRLASLLDLERDAAEFGRLHYARIREHGPQRDHRQIVADPEGQYTRLLEYWFRGTRVVDYSRELAAERAGGPARELSLAGQALYEVRIDRDGVTGALGLALQGPAVSASPRPSRKGSKKPKAARSSTRLRVVRDGHVVDTRDVDLGVGPLEAVVDAPQLTLAHGGLLEDEAFRHVVDLLRGAVPSLIARAAEGLGQGGDVEWKRAAAEQLVLAWLRRVDADDVSAEVAAVPLFPGLGGGRHALAELRAEVAAGRKVRYVTEAVRATGSDGEGLVLQMSQAWDEVARRLLGGQGLTNWTGEWQARRARQTFLAQPLRPLALQSSDTAATVRVRQGGLEGVVGLLGAPSRGAASCSIALLREGRLLDTLSVTMPLPLEAAFASDDFEADRTWRCLASTDGAAVEGVLAALQRGMTQAVAAAAAEAAPHSVRALHALTWLVAAWRGRLDGAARDADLQQRLEGAPLLERLDGARVSLRAVAAEREQMGRVLFVRPSVDGLAEGLVLRLDEHEERVLRDAVSPLVDFERELTLDALARRNREKRRLRVRGLGGETLLARVTVEAEGMRGELGVARSLRSSVILARDDVALRDAPLFDEVPVVGVVEGALEPTRTWDDVKLRTAQAVALGEALSRLMVALVAAVEQHEGAAAVLLTYVAWCRKQGRKLDETILAAPLFRRVGGGRASLTDLTTASRAGEVLYARHDGQADATQLVVLAEAPAARFLTEYFGRRKVREVDPPPVATFARDLMARASDLGRSTLAGVKRASDAITGVVASRLEERARVRAAAAHEAQARAAEQREEERLARKRQMREASRREREEAEAAAVVDPLEEALRGCFRALPWVAGCRWPGSLLSEIRLGPVKRGALLGLSDRGALVLEGRHALVRKARALPLHDREVVACLASAVFTELNRLRADVADEDEMRFMLDLADWVAQDGSTS